jgi:alanyl-tRNA synthetase
MKTNDIRQAYLEFFTHKDRHHKKIPPAPLIPPGDPTTLFTGSGMQQLVPYLKGEPHPMGKRLVDSQPCFRAEDIEEVGDSHHTTFFEMLGNWSLGDYFKQDQLTWIWEFFTKTLNLPQDKLHLTLFQGNQDVPKDKESFDIWKKIGIPESRIHYYPAEKNWWSRAGTPDKMPPGEIGGTTCEVFFEFQQLKHNPKFGKTCHPNCGCGKFIEIGNSVFMEYEKQAGGSLKPLPKKNVDFGGGLERLAQAVQNQPDIFQIDIFKSLIKTIESTSDQKYQANNQAPMRVIADHLRAAKAMIDEGIEPSNKQQGYILRRLIRRSAVKMRQLTGELDPQALAQIIKARPVLIEEIKKFQSTLNHGLKEFEKLEPNQLNELNAFNLFQTYGFPFEISEELFREKGQILDKKKFEQVFEGHKKLSRAASTGMFKGGLEDQSEETKKLHTATHLLHQSLRQVLGSHVQQEGSNITAERLRFDFTHSQALSPDQLKKVEKIINQQIKKNLPVKKTIQAKDKALKSGVLAFFKETYPDKVSVYSIGDFSQELCGGPHVTSTAEIGGVKIIKQESVAAGKRRIYAVLKNGTQKPVHQT